MRTHLMFVFVLLGTAASNVVAASDFTMRAAVVSAGRIQIRDVARPVAGPGQVLVRIRYAGINPTDWKTAGGSTEDPTAGNPSAADTGSAIAKAAASAIPGVDGAGVIAAIGSGVAGYKIGDAVILWSPSRGTYAQYVAVPADTITLKPDSMSYAQAAGVAHAALAAWNMLVDVAQVHSGQTVLVLGGAGGVGSAAVQIAGNRGAHVIATASARNADYLKALGAGTVIDYNTQHFEDQLRNIDVALNTVDLDNAYRALAVLRRGGHLVSLVGLPAAAQCAARAVICSSRSLNGTPIRATLKQIADWSRAGIFTVKIDQTFELTEVLKAWQYSQAGHTRGKSVVRIGD